MIDREKVENGLRCHAGCERGFDCGTCNYIGHSNCSELLARDSLFLLKWLKEREVVEPILIREGRNKNYNDYVCPQCDNEVVYEQNYCSECGVKFMWEGRQSE